MNSFHKSDQILNEWNAIANRAQPPARAPRGSAHRGSVLKLGLAVGVAALLVAAVMVPRALTNPNVADSSPSGSAVVATASATPSATTSPSASPARPSTSPSSTPSGSPGVDPRVPTASAIKITTNGVDGGWKGFDWTKLGRVGVDNLASLSGPVIRWAGGYAITESLGSGAASRVFLSRDGITWTEAFDAQTVLVANGPAGLLVLTSQDPTVFPTAVVAWTTQDGSTWTRAGDASALDNVHELVGNDGAYLATTLDKFGDMAALRSTDGVHWSAVSPEAGVTWNPGSLLIRSAAGRLFLSGDVGGGTADAGSRSAVDGVLASLAMSGVTWWSDDGSTWTRAGGLEGIVLTSIEGTSAGLLAQTAVIGTPGGMSYYWSHDGGKTWQIDATSSFGPLGMATCQGECAVTPDGAIGSNGSIFLAVKNNGKTWTSKDGTTWQPIASSATTPKAGATIVVLPRGVIFEYREAYVGTTPTCMYGAAK